MTSYNYYGWGPPGLSFPPGYPYGSQSQGLNLSAAMGNPALSGPSPSVNQAAANSGQNGEQPPESEDDLEFVNMDPIIKERTVLVDN